MAERDGIGRLNVAMPGGDTRKWFHTEPTEEELADELEAANSVWIKDGKVVPRPKDAR